jgi:OmpA family
MRRLVPVACACAVVAFGLVRAADAPVRIPLCTGLTIVTAINEKDGRDYESIKRIESVDPDVVRLKYESDHPPATLDFASSRHTSAKRAIRQRDLESAPEYMQIFNPKLPDLLPGTTAIGISRASLKDLKTKGETSLVTYLMQAPPEEWPPHIKPDGIETASTFNPKRTGTVKRVEPNDVPVKVIVNDQPIELPAIHAAGQVGYTKHEIYVLDDPDNPIALRYTFDTDVLNVVKISFPPCGDARPADPPAGGGAPSGSGAGGSAAVGTAGGGGGGAAPHIAKALAETGHADVYGIYFDFDSDRIKDESEPVLQEIAGILEKNPAWKLEVNGHTDNIGGDPYNLKLSTRRAAAVKQALVARYHVAPTRLATNGVGASQPKAPNDTLEGRAQNRRVELVRR